MAERDFLTFEDLSKAKVDALLALAQKMKAGSYREKPLAGKTLGMIFAKSSTRTRVSFEVGTYQLGGHALFRRHYGSSISARHDERQRTERSSVSAPCFWRQGGVTTRHPTA
jgi:ornithine carbamoyltransferase